MGRFMGSPRGKTVSCCLLVLLMAAGDALHAQGFSWDSGAAEKYMKGVTNVAASLLSDALSPMTHYKEGEWRITLVPAYINVRRVFEDPAISGKDLRGWSLGIGGGYAFSDRLMAYFMASYLNIAGTVEGTFYGNSLATVRGHNRLDLVSIAAGAGFDCIGGDHWLSIPVFLGMNIQGYAMELKMPMVTLPSTDTARLSIDDGGVLAGFTAGIAVSAEILGKGRVTPYFLYAMSFNRPGAAARLDMSTGGLPYSVEVDVESDRLSAFMFGLSLSLKTTRRVSLSASVGGVLSSSTGFYNRTFLDGLNMISIVLAISYNGFPQSLQQSE